MDVGSERPKDSRSGGGVKPIRHFRDLIVYQQGLQLALQIYRLCEQFPERERWGLESQIKRAAVSVVLNIAEGYGK